MTRAPRVQYAERCAQVVARLALDGPLTAQQIAAALGLRPLCAHRTLRRMLDETTFDEAAFRTLADKVAKQQVELMIARAKMKSRLLAVLNPAQQAKAEQILRLTSPPPHGPGKPF